MQLPEAPSCTPVPSCLQDEQRLELLKEIGGTRVYEDRRKESFRVMEECQSKRTHIQDLVRTRRRQLARAPLRAERRGSQGAEAGVLL